MTDLFGNPLSEQELYDRAPRKRRDPLPQGHAAAPGTGPDGETCGSCRNLYGKRMSKTYYKCKLTEAAWTGGRKTDVRVRDPACKFWESKDD